MNNSDFDKYASALEEHHAIFYALWQQGRPVMDDSISTAAISFDKEGETLSFIFNPDFWEKLDEYERQFVICHEMLHIVLNHGRRTRDNTQQRKRANVALDVVVNHLLVDKFGFKRDKISINDEICWRDTIKSLKNSPPFLSFEQYYNLIPPNPVIELSIGVLDDHGSFESIDQKDVDKVLDGAGELLGDDEKQSAQEALGSYVEKDANQKAGKGSGSTWLTANVGNVEQKKKWETVIKKWSKKYLKQSDFDTLEQWTHMNRRFAELPRDMFLPSDHEREKKSKGKIEVCFFQDTSGSCRGFRDRFFKAAMSLPKKTFDVRMFCFDTRVYPTSLESRKLYGFGGTTFSCIEHYIQSTLKEEIGKYPEAVFVITDGYGNNVHPERPENWYWFLSTGCDRLIPKESHRFLLRNYE